MCSLAPKKTEAHVDAAMMTPHDEPLLTPHAHFGLVVAMGQGNLQGELAGDPRGIARFYPALEMAMWQGDSQGDSLGIPGGFARLLGDSL